VGEWIKHLDGKEAQNESEISEIKDQLFAIQNDLSELKEFISFFKPQLTQALSKQTSTNANKQTRAASVQTPVQTAVQTEILSNLTVMERAIVWALLNSEMKLSYEDLAALLGKDKSTIRGQINVIKQKSEGLIEEYREITGKKRLYIPEEIRNRILKGVKIKVEGPKKAKKEKSESYDD
jgi:predicted transcriptional regulator